MQKKQPTRGIHVCCYYCCIGFVFFLVCTAQSGTMNVSKLIAVAKTREHKMPKKNTINMF